LTAFAVPAERHPAMKNSPFSENHHPDLCDITCHMKQWPEAW
jgi:hypothetical protein